MKLTSQFQWSKVNPNAIQCWGELSHEEREYFESLDCDITQSGKFTVIESAVPLFEDYKKYKYMDGFSPNLNKTLHVGHFSNLVMAKAFQYLGIAEQTVCIYGDLLEGTNYENTNYTKFGYRIDSEFYASEMQIPDGLIDGEGDYAGTKVIMLGNSPHVCVKKNGATTYMSQDIAFAQLLNAPTLYITGYEQTNHFNELSKMFPHIDHVGLGLVKLDGAKMSSREGNVIYMKELIDSLTSEFKSEFLAYNVFAGYILEKGASKDKSINMDLVKDYNKSSGLYLSYTMARLKGLSRKGQIEYGDYKLDNKLWFHYLLAKACNSPNMLYSVLLDYCKNVNATYEKVKCSDFPSGYNNYYGNIRFFSNKLGLYFITEMDKR